MGVIAIPPNPDGPGPCRVHLELDKEEARATIDRLKHMLKALQARASQLPPQDSAAQQICVTPSELTATTIAPPLAPPVQPAAANTAPPQPSPALAPPPVPMPQQLPPQLPITQPMLTASIPLNQDGTSQPAPQASSQVPYPPIYAPQPQSKPPVIPPQQAQLPQYTYFPTPQEPTQQQLLPPQPPAQLRPQQPSAAPLAATPSIPLQVQAPPASNTAAAAAAAAAAALSANRSAMSLAAMRPGIQQAAHQQAATAAAQQQAAQLAAGGVPQSQPPRPTVLPTHIPSVAVAPKQAPVVPQTPAVRPVASTAPAAAASSHPASFPAPGGTASASVAAAAAAAAGQQARMAAPNPTAAAAGRPAAGVPAKPAAPAPASRPAAAPATAGPRPPPGPVPSLTWEVCLVTDAMDHNKDPVQALQYCSALEGLAGGDGHGGWLISSSRKLLNLWECSAGGGRGAPSLMFSHGQETDFSASHLAAEPAVQLLYASSADARTGAEYVTVHSLSPDAGMLAFKYKLAVAPGGQRAVPSGAVPPARQLTKVVSLHPFGGGLRSTCGAAYQGTVHVFDCPGLTSPASSRSTADGLPPKGSWRASEGAAISCLAASTAGGARVATGTRDGSVVLWDMRQRPPANIWRCRGHSQLISGLQLPNDVNAVTGSPDGKVHIWDLRSTGAPRASATPDGSAVLAVKTSPAGDCVAVTTQRGLLTVDLLDPSAATTALTTVPVPRPFLDITWNTSTAEIYAAAPSGSITVFRQAYA